MANSGTTYTLAQVQADIATTRSAISEILSNGQSRSIKGRTLTSADLGQLREHLSWLTDEESRLTARASRTGIRTTKAVSRWR